MSSLPSATARTARNGVLGDQLLASGRGDASAFAAMYESLSPRVYGLVQRVLQDVHQSEEVTQEVFLEIWQTSTRFDPTRGSAPSWVMTLAHRRAVDRVRSAEASRRRDTTEVERSRTTPIDETATSAHASLDAQEVRAALGTLPDFQRQALELAYFGGHTHLEVSRMMRIPLGTAKTRIRDGLVRLRDALTPLVPEPLCP